DTGVLNIAVAPGNSSVLLVNKLDVNFQDVIFGSTDGGNTWAESQTSNLGTITGLDIDRASANTAYLSRLGPRFGDPHILMTTDTGLTWLPRSTGIPPALNVWAVRIDPLNSSVLYCGTDSGVYRSTDRGLNWSPFSAGLPAV